MIDSAPDGLTIVDHQGVIVWNNNACKGIFGVERSEVVNKHVNVFVRKRLINQSVSMKVLTRSEPASVHHITRVKNQDLSTGVPIFDRRGNIAFVSILSRDMAQLKAQEISCMTTKYPKNNLQKYIREELEITKKMNQRGFVIKSPKVLELLPLISEATKSESTVLLHGEAGVGKATMAKLIHDLGYRENKPFIHVNCHSIPKDLIESELFGCERGAFTGARKNWKKGMIEAAEGGTLYLDEISALDMSLRSKLLQMLQDNTIQRTGGNRPIKVNVRIVAASSHDIKAMVEKKIFSADLFYRLSVIQMHIPPLRERQADIEELLLHYLRIFNKHYKKNVSFTSVPFLCLPFTIGRGISTS